ncbi:hypothetical protein Hbl1158_06145 [Halobaculum sp. CBA1158]|uniref:hypothetical protein n=1 Tax=Halobaculum sp. CBA1158 TaxID=2904243 RepID=UPI001F44E45B|nr:hypothetical protein [Halobaculum sp. CBA1158]UIP00936.1 hypothetical protein Hbl1158_06145 [Halobaculum sp. CBA1158]
MFHAESTSGVSSRPSAASSLPLFGPVPDGSGLAVTLLIRLVPALCVALVLAWDAGRRSDNPRAWPTAALLVGVAGGALAPFVVGGLYLVAGRDRPPVDPAERYDGRE